MYSDRLIIKASEINLAGKEQIVKYVIDTYERSQTKDLDAVLSEISLPTLSINEVLDIAGEVLIRLEKGNLLQREVANSKRLRGFSELRVLEGHPSRCKEKECFDCSGCRLDESMPCLPSCSVLDPITGEIDKSYCLDNCDARLSNFIVIEIDQNGSDDLYRGQVEAENYDLAVKYASDKYSLDESRMAIYRVE